MSSFLRRIILSPEVIKFLRKEALKFYNQLDWVQKKLTSKQAIYLGLKKSWKVSPKLNRSQRERAKDLPINFKQMSDVQKSIGKI